MIIAKDLLNIIVCPQCKGEVGLSIKHRFFLCHNCRLIYEIREGIPIMIIEKIKECR